MPFCSKCGAQVAESSAFCPQCGQAQPGARATTPAAEAQSGLSENVAGLFCYLVGWITGLIFFFIDKRPYVRFHAAQSMVVFGALHILSMLVGMYFGLGWLLGGWSHLGFGFILHRLVDLAVFVLWIFLMVKAYQGEKFRIPLAADLADRLAGQ